MAEYKVKIGTYQDPLNENDFNTAAQAQYYPQSSDPRPTIGSTGYFVDNETEVSVMPSLRFYTYKTVTQSGASVDKWKLNYIYEIEIGNDTDFLDVEDFNTKFNAQTSTVPEENSIGIFVCSGHPERVMPEGRFFTYNNKIWFLNVIPTDFALLTTGLASEFRENLNDNFAQISDQGDTIDKNLSYLRDKLKPVATTASANDIIEPSDGSRRFVSDSNKEYWNERGIYVTGDSQVHYDDGSGTAQDITAELGSYLNQNIPSTTQDLGNYDSRFILLDKDNYSRPQTNYWSVDYQHLSNYDITITDHAHSEYGWQYTVIFKDASINPVVTVGGEQVIKEQIPYVFFDQNTYNNALYSSTCVSGRDSVSAEKGWIKFGSTTDTFPQNFNATFVVMDYSTNLG